MAWTYVREMALYGMYVLTFEPLAKFLDDGEVLL